MNRFARTLGFLIAAITTIGAQGQAVPDTVHWVLRDLAAATHAPSPTTQPQR